MKYQVITVDNALKRDQKIEECMEIHIKIGNQLLKISENSNSLSIHVDGSLLILPVATNAISLSEIKDK